MSLSELIYFTKALSRKFTHVKQVGRDKTSEQEGGS